MIECRRSGYGQKDDNCQGRLNRVADGHVTSGLEDPEQDGMAATPYLRLMALTVVGYLWSRMAAVAVAQLGSGSENHALLESKVYGAQFYFEKVLPESEGLLSDIKSGKGSVMELGEQHWTA
jgi:hypothetical protein